MRFRRILSVLLLALLFTTQAFSQDCTDGPGLPGDDPDTTLPCDVPLDNWVTILVIAGIAFGGYKLNQKQKTQPVLN